jgi:Domain of unknown function (DUF4258)
MGRVIDLNSRRKPAALSKPTLRDLVLRVRELAKDSANMGLPHPHLKMRMKQRGKTMRDILETVKKGEGVSGPQLDRFGDWRIKLRRCVAGKRTQIVIAVRDADFSVITVF